MLKLANMNLAYQRYPIEYFLDSTRQLGIKAIELWGGEPHLYVEEATHSSVRSLLKQINARNLELICFTPEQCTYPVNLAYSEETSRKRSVNYFKKSIEIAHSLECPFLLISAGYGFFHEDKEEAWKKARHSLQEITKLAEEKEIMLVLEPFFYPYSNIVIDLQTTKRMLSEVNSPFLKTMIDLPCMMLAGDTIEEYGAAFGENMAHVHFVDGEPHTSAHLALGEGKFPLNLLKKSLDQINYEGHLTLEFFGNQYNADPNEGVKKSLEFINTHWS